MKLRLLFKKLSLLTLTSLIILSSVRVSGDTVKLDIKETSTINTRDGTNSESEDSSESNTEQSEDESSEEDDLVDSDEEEDTDSGGSVQQQSVQLDSVQITKSMALSQFVRPFANNVYNVMGNENMKSALPELYNDGKIPDIVHVPLLLKEGEEKYRRATVKDLFELDSSGNPNEFYIKYEYEVLVPGTDPAEYTTEVDYEQVFYTNAYSYFYLSLFASHDTNIAENWLQSKTKPLFLDMYGNIVLDDSKGNKKHTFMVIPNIANPFLFDSDEFFMPTRKLLSLFQTDLHAITELGNISRKKMESMVGDKLDNNEIGIYDMDSDFFNYTSLYILPHGNGQQFLSPEFDLVDVASANAGALGDDKDALLTKEYKRFLNADSSGTSDTVGSLTLFTYGDGHDLKFANRFQTDSYQQDLKLIVNTGVGRKNSSMAVLPSDRIYWGDAFNTKSITVDSDSILNSTYNIDYYDISNYSIYGNDILNGKADWSDNFTANEIVVILKNTESYADEYKSEIFETVTGDATDKELIDKKPSDTLVEKPQDLYDQKVNFIIDNIDHLFRNMGSGSSAIRTSRMSTEYKHVTSKFDRNFMFHLTDILEDREVKDLVGGYVKFLLYINAIITLYIFVRIMFKSTVPVSSFFSTSAKCIALSLLPIIIFNIFVSSYNLITERVFKDSFIFWTTMEVDLLNRVGDEESQVQQEINSYFREYNLSSIDSGSTITMYTESEDEPLEKINLKTMATEYLHHGGTTEDEIFGNKDKYYKSIFYYFYDRYKWHFYNYYSAEIANGSIPDWSNERGLVGSKNNAVAMLTDPVFLFGQDYLDISTSSDFNKLDVSQWVNVGVQDIAGLSPLFSKQDTEDTSSFYDDVSFSRWFENIARKGNLLDSFDSNGIYTYPDEIIYGSMQSANRAGKESLSDIETKFDRINRNVAKRLMTLYDYSDCTDETILFIAALLTTFEFNQVMNESLPKEYTLYPTTINSESLNMDTIYRGMYLERVEDNETYKGDVMSAVETKGGFFAQGLILVSSFIGQVCGFVAYVCILLLFLFSVYVFTFSYSINRNKSNKAWLGLLFFGCSILVVHLAFLLVVNGTCVPSYAVIRTSMFGGFTGILKNVVLLIAMVSRTFIVLWLVAFALKHPADLGGSIVAEKANIAIANIKGSMKSDGDNETQSNNVNLSTENTNVDNSQNVEVENGTSQVVSSDVTVATDTDVLVDNADVAMYRSSGFSSTSFGSSNSGVSSYSFSSSSGMGDVNNVVGSIPSNGVSVSDTDSSYIGGSLVSNVEQTDTGVISDVNETSVGIGSESNNTLVDSSVNSNELESNVDITNISEQSVSNVSNSDNTVSTSTSDNSNAEYNSNLDDHSMSSNSTVIESVGSNHVGGNTSSVINGVKSVKDDEEEKEPATAQVVASGVQVEGSQNTTSDKQVVKAIDGVSSHDSESANRYNKVTNNVFNTELKQINSPEQTNVNVQNDKALSDSLSELISLMKGGE